MKIARQYSLWSSQIPRTALVRRHRLEPYREIETMFSPLLYIIITRTGRNGIVTDDFTGTAGPVIRKTINNESRNDIFIHYTEWEKNTVYHFHVVMFVLNTPIHKYTNTKTKRLVFWGF